MAADPDDEALREMAQHRGFRLVKSRRRKPGTGDYGRYGLADAQSGKPLLGFGENGLTATGAEIAAYLHSGEVSTWRQSVSTTPDLPRVARPKPERTIAEERKPATPAPVAAAEPAPPPVEKAPAALLRIRPAARADAEAIAALIGGIGGSADAAGVAARVAGIVRAKAARVADRDGVIGCVAWHVVPTLQHGPVGRITLILVAADERRSGIGRALLAAAEAALRAAGCAAIEAMSDVEIGNSHGFFRKLGFAQTSYRFARPIGRP